MLKIANRILLVWALLLVGGEKLMSLEATEDPLLVNGGFDDGLGSWQFYTNGAGRVEECRNGWSGGPGIKVVIDSDGSNTQLYQENLSIEPGQEYVLSFSAYSESGADMHVGLVLGDEPLMNIDSAHRFWDRIQLEQRWQNYFFKFTAEGDSFHDATEAARFIFWFAGGAKKYGEAYCIDNVILAPLLDGVEQAPGPPGNLMIDVVTPPHFDPSLDRYNGYNTEVRLEWDESEEDDLLGYLIYRDGECIAAELSNRFVDHFPMPGANYDYYVTAVDVCGNESLASHVAPVTIHSGVNVISGGEFGGWLLGSRSQDRWLLSVSDAWGIGREDAPDNLIGRAKIFSHTKDAAWSLSNMSTGVEKNTQYQMSFAARSDFGSDIRLGIWGTGSFVNSPVVLKPVVFNLTPEWQTFTVNFDTNDIDVSLAFFYFYSVRETMAIVGEEINIDHVVAWTTVAGEILRPESPQDLRARFVSDSVAYLSWEVPEGTAGVCGYNIYRDGEYVGLSYTASYIEGGLNPCEAVEYSVTAFDSEGRESELSEPCRASCLDLKVSVDNFSSYADRLFSANGLSPDGSVVVGDANLYKPNSYPERTQSQPVLWTREKGLVGLGHRKTYNSGYANDVSLGGAVVIGSDDEIEIYDEGRVRSISEGLRWTESGGLEGLGHRVLPSESDDYIDFGGSATAVSSDGLVIVGNADNPEWRREAFLWTESDGFQGLGFVGNDFESEALGVSHDGTTIVGMSEGDYYNGDHDSEAFRWNTNDGMIGLGSLGNSGYSRATGASFDGSVIVGGSRNSEGFFEAFRWTESEGMVGLGDIDGFRLLGEASDVSYDGSIVVGSGTSESPPSLGVFWKETMDWEPTSLNEFLDTLGFDRKGFSFGGIKAVSGDGTVFLGRYYRLKIHFDRLEEDISDFNLISNGGFEEGADSWTLSRWERSNSGEPFGIEMPGFVEERSAELRLGNLASDPKDLFLKQGAIELEPNKTYYLSFSVRGFKEGKVEVKLVRDDDPAVNYGVEEVFYVGTDWRTYFIEFSTDGLGEAVSNGKLQFRFNRGGRKSALSFYLDDVAIHER